jgi:hypothetical protein
LPAAGEEAEREGERSDHLIIRLGRWPTIFTPRSKLTQSSKG